MDITCGDCHSRVCVSHQWSAIVLSSEAVREIEYEVDNLL
jgi:hypothetical protein